jgi:hypothetical protein
LFFEVVLHSKEYQGCLPIESSIYKKIEIIWQHSTMLSDHGVIYQEKYAGSEISEILALLC